MNNIYQGISINKNTDPLVDELIKNEKNYRIEVHDGPKNCKIIDAGIKVQGCMEVGLKIAEICLGGLGKVEILPPSDNGENNWCVNVRANHAVLACLGSQYAGWSLNHKDFFSLGSGPARAIAQREEIFSEINYSDAHTKTVLVLEVEKEPPVEIIEKISNDCKIKPENLTFILTPTTSISGNLQVISRILEVAIHKAHELNFPLENIIDGMGTTPIPPIGKNFIEGMGRTNDSIIYGGTVILICKGSDEELKNLSKNLTSKTSKDYGKPFKDIFEAYNRDFYKIDGSLFSPAKVIINSIESGKTFISGEINNKLLKKSFF